MCRCSDNSQVCSHRVIERWFYGYTTIPRCGCFLDSPDLYVLLGQNLRVEISCPGCWTWSPKLALAGLGLRGYPDIQIVSQLQGLEDFTVILSLPFGYSGTRYNRKEGKKHMYISYLWYTLIIFENCSFWNLGTSHEPLECEYVSFVIPRVMLWLPRHTVSVLEYAVIISLIHLQIVKAFSNI